MKYVLSVADRERGRQRALSAQSRRRRRQTWTRYRAEEKEAVRILRQRGLVPLAIGPALNMPDSTVAVYLGELEREGAMDPIPVYLSFRTPDEGGIE